MASKEKSPEQDTPRRGGDLFIVDNSDTDWKVREYLRDWVQAPQGVKPTLKAWMELS